MRYSAQISDAFVTNQLAFIQLIQETLQADLDSLHLHFDKMAVTWPTQQNGQTVIETLLSLRPDCSRAQRKAITEQFSHHAVQHAASKQSQHQHQAQQAPVQHPHRALEASSAMSSPVGRSSPSSSFLGPNSGFWSLFQSRGKPAKKVKPSTKRSRAAAGGGGAGKGGRRQDAETISLEDFLR
jgi:hypothetical protein